MWNAQAYTFSPAPQINKFWHPRCLGLQDWLHHLFHQYYTRPCHHRRGDCVSTWSHWKPRPKILWSGRVHRGATLSFCPSRNNHIKNHPPGANLTRNIQHSQCLPSTSGPQANRQRGGDFERTGRRNKCERYDYNYMECLKLLNARNTAEYRMHSCTHLDSLNIFNRRLNVPVYSLKSSLFFCSISLLWDMRQPQTQVLQFRRLPRL